MRIGVSGGSTSSKLHSEEMVIETVWYDVGIEGPKGDSNIYMNLQ